MLPLVYLPKTPKGTTPIDFEEFFLVTKNYGDVAELLKQLTHSRKKTLDTIEARPFPNLDARVLVDEYFSFLIGLNEQPQDAKGEGEQGKCDNEAKTEAGESKAEKEKERGEKGEERKKEEKKEERKGPAPLNRAVPYGWNDFSRLQMPLVVGPLEFEVQSMLINLGLWYLSLASTLVEEKDDHDRKEKEAFKLCSQAAGIFQYVLEKGTDENGDLSDARPNVSRALVQVSLAVGQTIAVKRAEHGKHSPELIASLARDCGEKFLLAKNTLMNPNPTPKPEVDAGLEAFLAYKSEFYMSKAYFYHSVVLNDPENGGSVGKAIKALELSVNCMERAEAQYGVLVSLASTLKDKRYKETVELTKKATLERLEKVRKENDTVFFEKLPDSAEGLPEAKSNIDMIPYVFPETSPKWTKEIYAAILAKSDGVEDAKRGKKGSACCVVM